MAVDNLRIERRRRRQDREDAGEGKQGATQKSAVADQHGRFPQRNSTKRGKKAGRRGWNQAGLSLGGSALGSAPQSNFLYAKAATPQGQGLFDNSRPTHGSISRPL